MYQCSSGKGWGKEKRKIAKNDAACPGRHVLAQKDLLCIQEPALGSGTQLSSSEGEGKYEKSWLGKEGG